MKRIAQLLLAAMAFALLAGCESPPVKQAATTTEVQGTHFVLDEALLFARGSAKLKKGSGAVLDKLVPELQKARGKFTVQGHADATGNDAINKKLSQKRADVVKDALIKRGIAADRIRAKGYSSSRPIVKDAKTAADHQKNRRVVIVFTDDVSVVD